MEKRDYAPAIELLTEAVEVGGGKGRDGRGGEGREGKGGRREERREGEKKLPTKR